MIGNADAPALFDYPARAKVGRVVPKNRICAAGKPGRRVREQITRQVDKIIWQNKLAPETINLPNSRAVPEIQVFTVALKPGGLTDGLPDDILRCIDRAIDFPIIFELTASSQDDATANRIRVIATHKRPSEAEAGKWVIGNCYFATDWLPADIPRVPLPVALDLDRLYEQMLRQLIPLSARDGESLASLVERYDRIAVKRRECQRLEARLHREKHFSRKVELNRELRELRSDLAALTR